MKRTWKRIGSLLLTFCMVFTMLPTVAFAETVDVDSGTPLGMSGTITAFAPLDEDVAEQTEEIGTTKEELKLPNKLAVTVTASTSDDEAVNGDDIATDSDAQEKETPKETQTTVAVSEWASDPAYDGDAEGVYTFTPLLELPDGVTVADGVSVPTITVTVRVAKLAQSQSLSSSDDTVTIKEEDEISDIRAAIETALETNSTVTVSGSKTEVNETLALVILPGKTVVWQAKWVAKADFKSVLIDFQDSGTFEVASGGEITAENASVIHVRNSGMVKISGGSVSSSGDTAKTILATEGTVIINGGTVTATGVGVNCHAVSATAGSTVTVNGGTIRTTGESTCSIYVSSTSNITVNNGTVSAAGEKAIAIIIFNDSTGQITGGTISSSGDIGHALKVELGGYGESSLMISNGTICANGVKSTALRIYGSTVIMENGEIQANGTEGTGVYASKDSNLTVKDGAINADGEGGKGVEVWGATNAEVQGGTISAMGDQGDAIYIDNSFTPIQVRKGSTIRATTGKAIHYLKNLTVDGGTIFAYGAKIFGTNNVISREPTSTDGNTIAGEDLVILGWNQAAGNTIYLKDTSADISTYPDGVTAKWSAQGSDSGISYSHGTNSGFIKLPVTVLDTLPVDQLDAPTGLAWDGATPGKATWDAVTNAIGYSVQLYKGDVAVGSPTTGVAATEYDFMPAIAASGDGSYIFKVQAVGDGINYITSPHSPASVPYIVTPPVAPIITDITVPMAVTYSKGNILNFIVAFSEPVTVTGTPRLMLIIDSGNKYANYVSGNGTNKLKFAYTVERDDVDPDGILLLPAIEPIGGVIKNLAGKDAVLTFTPPDTSGIVVDGVSPVIYTIHGTIKGSDTNRGIAGAAVIIKTPGGIPYFPASTNADGKYSSIPLTAGRYSMEVSALGYNTAIISDIVISGADAIRDVTLIKTGGGATTYAVTVNGSYASPTGAGSYAKDTTVNIYAGNRSNYTFTGWTSSDVTITGGGSKNASFVMPDNTVTVTANWSDNGGGGGNGGGSGGGSYTPPPTTTPETKPSQPVTVTTPVTATAGANGTASANVSDKAITDAIAKAQSDAKAQGSSANGIAVVLDITMPQGATSLSAALSQNALQSLVSAGVTSLTLSGSPVKVIFDLKALQEIQKQSNGTINISIAPQAKLSDSAKKIIGTRPVYNLTVGYGSGQTVSGFGAGSVSVTIPYTLGANEKAGNVQAVYVDAKGNVQWLMSSVYDSVNKLLRFSTNHFSTYGVGYKQDVPNFTDVGGHWAKDDIAFVVSRGLFSGTSTTTFSPNTAMTRGMFVTALGRLANADVSGYAKSSFTDVKSDAYYMGYIEWASKNNIVNGTGDGKFAPDQSISREQVAVIMSNYAKTIGFTLPKVHAENIFTDSAKISAYAKDAVKTMQMAGVISGKNGNLFDPQGTATRAEVSAVLRRLVELAISSDTAQRWTMNDSGKWMYYENGNPVTGKKDIDGVVYTFDQYGVMADVPKNLKYTTYTVQKGDSFWRIAHKLGCTMSELERLNNKDRFALIHPGDVLRVPEK